MGAIDLSLFGPMLEPLILQCFDNIVYPKIKEEADKITSPDVALFVQALLPALKSAIDEEIKKLGK